MKMTILTTKIVLKRLYHPYEKWEEHKMGMWRKVSRDEEAVFFPKAVEFTGNAKLYGSFMLRVTKEWPFSCEHNLTDSSLNRQAWIGHAACCIALNCPEYITRLAWWELTQKQQDDANAQADAAIQAWELSYVRRCHYIASGSEQINLCFDIESALEETNA